MSRKKDKDNTLPAQYYHKSNTIKINANSTDFYPQYLKYVFEYLKIPQNAKIVFNDKTITGGIQAWLQETNDSSQITLKKEN